LFEAVLGKTWQRSWAEWVFEGCKFGGLTTRRATQSNDERIRSKMGADSAIENVDGRAEKGAEASVRMLVTCPCLLQKKGRERRILVGLNPSMLLTKNGQTRRQNVRDSRLSSDCYSCDGNYFEGSLPKEGKSACVDFMRVRSN